MYHVSYTHLHLFTFLIEDLAQVIYLEIIYFLVIYLIQCVQLSTCLLRDVYKRQGMGYGSDVRT